MYKFTDKEGTEPFDQRLCRSLGQWSESRSLEVGVGCKAVQVLNNDVVQ